MGKGNSTLTISLLLLCTAVPSLRCLIPTETLNAQERACCKRMAGQCGTTPANHECCKKTISNAQPAVASSKTTVVAPEAALSRRVLALSVIALQSSALADTELLDPSPPPNTFALLRI